MKEALISFETAKLAKEKGFNEESTHVYTIGFNSIKEDKEPRPFGNYENNPKLLQPVCLSKSQPHLALAPTQSLLQKWLREHHDIYVDTRHDLTPKGTGILYYTNWGFIKKNEKNKAYSHHGGYDEFNEWTIYEDAFEYGLKEALKLIP